MSESTTAFDPNAPLQERRRRAQDERAHDTDPPERDSFASILPDQEKSLFKRPKGRLGMG